MAHATMSRQRRLPLAIASLGVAVVAAGAGGLVGFTLSDRSPTPVLGSFQADSGSPGSPSTGSSAASASTVTVTPSVAPTTTAPVTTSIMAPAGDVRTYVLTGGRITVSFNGERAEILEIMVAEGYTADEPTRGPSGAVEVNLRSGSRHSQLRASYEGGPKVQLDDH
jgi:hypothetical protein